MAVVGSNDSVDEIKQRLSIEDVVGGYVQLKPAGRNLKALCPFHQEKTPSFIVSPDKGIYHCFGCSAGGDIFEFVMKMEGLDFRGALEQLARQAGVELSAYQSKGNRQLRDRLLRAHNWATHYYHTALANNQSAKNYLLRDRGLSRETIKSFGLGYAPATRSGLVDFLRSKGFKDEEILHGGLARTAGGKIQDLFFKRIMIPLRDGSGQTVGFTGRVLPKAAGKGPKYLNTPQTLIYDKSQLLFGWDQAKDTIRTSDEAVVVEGNMDVIASHQAGIKQVVASSGTALTARQIKTLARLTKNLKLAFDDDNAGLAATERTIPLAQEAGVYLYIVQIKNAKDPDELIARDAKQWQAVIKSAPYVLDWLLRQLTRQFDAASATGKKQISDRFTATLAKVRDPVETDHYVRQLAGLTNTSPEAIAAKLAGVPPPSAGPAKTPTAATQTAPPPKHESDIVQEALLALTASYPDTRTSLQDVAETYFTTPDRRQLYSQLRSQAAVVLSEKIPSDLKNLENYVKILLLKGEAQYEGWPAVDRRIEAFSLAQRLHIINMKQVKTDLSEKIRRAEIAGDKELVACLLEEYQSLVKKR